MSKKEKYVSFREEQGIINLIDKMAELKGCDRSDIIRDALRVKLKQEEAILN